MPKTRRKTRRKSALNSTYKIVSRGVSSSVAFAVITCFVVAAVITAVVFYYYLNSRKNQSVDNEELSIHFLELGTASTGDCSLIKVGNTEVLIDAGAEVGSLPTVQNYLDRYVTDGKIEYVIATHAHEDHIACFGTDENTQSILDLYDIGTIIQFVYTSFTPGKESKVYLNYLREIEEAKSRGTNVYNAYQCVEGKNGAQRVYDLSSTVQLEILKQKFYYEAAGNENNNSVCCQIVQNHEKYYLFTGDLMEESGAEKSLVEQNDLHQVEVYKAGHHGSKTSSSQTLLQAIRPKYVCVCCAAGSSQYNAKDENTFPTQAMINRVAPYTDRVYVTTLCLNYSKRKYESMNGDIIITCQTNDQEITVKCSHDDTILKNTTWFADNRQMPAAWSA